MRSFWLLLLLLPSCTHQTTAPQNVVLLTDFGLKDDAVGIMKGVIVSIAPDVRILDLTHEVTPFDVAQGARRLKDAPRFYPPGTVFVVVVDPGVGTERRAIAVRLPGGTMIIAPDNGVVDPVASDHWVEVREVTNPALLLDNQSATFHGRDVFAPVGAHLAAGFPYEKVGPLVTDWEGLKQPVPTQDGHIWSGRVDDIDEPFGNVWTNIPATWAGKTDASSKRVFSVAIGEGPSTVHLDLPLVETFGDVGPNTPLLYENSRGALALAINQGDFARFYSVEPGMTVVLEEKRKN